MGSPQLRAALARPGSAKPKQLPRRENRTPFRRFVLALQFRLEYPETTKKRVVDRRQIRFGRSIAKADDKDIRAEAMLVNDVADEHGASEP